MAFLSKFGNVLKQTTSKQLSANGSLSSPSLFQAIRCMSSSKLFIGGMEYGMNEDSLREAFSKYGEVVETRVILDRETGRSRGFGFVTFTSTEAASSAIQALDGQDLHGRIVKVNYAHDRTSGGGGYGGGGYGGGGSGGYGGGGAGGYGGGGYGTSGGYGSSGYGESSTASAGAVGGYNGSGGYGEGSTANAGAVGGYGSGNTYGSSNGGFAGENQVGGDNSQFSGENTQFGVGGGQCGGEAQFGGMENGAVGDFEDDTDVAKRA